MLLNQGQEDEKIAFLSEEGDLMSYGALRQEVDGFRAYLKQGDVVLCLCANEIASAIGYLSCLEYQSVPMLFESSLAEEQLDDLIERYSPNFLWAPSQRFLQSPRGDSLHQIGDYELRSLAGTSPVEVHSDLALLLTTSGSLGSPKLVRISKTALVENTRAICDFLSMDASSRGITTLPSSYTYGLSVINSHLLSGASMVMTKKSLVEKGFMELLRKHRVTNLAGVPYSYAILRRLGFFKADNPDLRTLTQAGGKLPADLHEEIAAYAIRFDKQFYAMYGQTEATARIAYLPPKDAHLKIGSVGVSIPGGSIQLLDENGTEITKPEVIGELVFRGPSVAMGYAESRLDLIRGDQNLGRLETGDLAKLDRDGYLYIVGRKRRFIKLFGNRINLLEIEERLNRAFSSAEFYCGGEDEKLRVFVKGSDPSLAIQRYLTQNFRIPPVALEVSPVDEIPRSISGKVDYSSLENAASQLKKR